MTAARTMFEKIWQRHVVVDRDDGYTLLYVDRHLMHDGSAAGFAQLRARGLRLRRPDRGFATPDHYVLSNSRSVQDIPDPHHRRLVEEIRENTAESGVTLFDLGDERQGIVHVVGPGAGHHPARPDPGVRRQPHLDARRARRARFRHRPVRGGACAGDADACGSASRKTMRVTRRGHARRRRHGQGRDPGDHRQDRRRRRSRPCGRVCRAAPSAACRWKAASPSATCRSRPARAPAWWRPTTPPSPICKGRPFAPKGAEWDAALAVLAHAAERSRTRRSTARSASMPRQIAPMVTWGTSPEDALPITGRIPEPSTAPDAAKRDSMERALDYMGLEPGTPLDRMRGGPRLHRLLHQQPHRGPARRRRGRQGPQGRDVPSWVVPGSGLVKKQAEAEGLDQIFLEAGFEWREPGCSMCVGMNGDIGRPASASPRPQPQLRRPPGPRRAHPSAEPGDGRRRGRHRPFHRRAPAAGLGE